MYQDQSDEDLDDIIISMSDGNKMSIFLPSIKELSSDLDDYHKMLVEFINFETGKTLDTIEDFGHIELLQELSGELRKFNVKMNCRKVLGFNRYESNLNSRKKPIRTGIFKGTFMSGKFQVKTDILWAFRFGRAKMSEKD